MGIVYACITPHGGEILPEIGGDLPAILDLRASMEELGRRMKQHRPDVIIVVTPHGLRLEGYNAVKKYVRDALAKIADLPVAIICPSHGPVLRAGVGDAISRYAEWAREDVRAPGQRVVVAYVSAYGNTGRLARAIADGLAELGVEPQLFDLGTSDERSVVAAIEAADGLLVGSPTLNRDAVRPIWLLLAGVSPIINRGKPAAAFGTFGWSGEAVKLIEDRLTGLQLKIAQPGLRVNFVPSPAQLDEARAFGRKFAAALPPR
ncbi:MAG: flavodoxin domain-containing protein [Chloroflexota bacterium]